MPIHLTHQRMRFRNEFGMTRLTVMLNLFQHPLFRIPLVSISLKCSKWISILLFHPLLFSRSIRQPPLLKNHLNNSPPCIVPYSQQNTQTTKKRYKPIYTKDLSSFHTLQDVSYCPNYLPHRNLIFK